MYVCGNRTPCVAAVTIDVSTIVGLRNQAFPCVLVYSFARVSAAVSLRVGDYYTQGPRSFFRLHEKALPCLRQQSRKLAATAIARRSPARTVESRGRSESADSPPPDCDF